MTDQRPEKQVIQDTESVVNQTWEELAGPEGIGEIVDATKATTEEIASRLNILIRRQKTFESVVKRTIAEEIEKQVKPLSDQLERFVEKNPKVVYLTPKFPNPFKWFVSVTYGRFKKKGVI